MKERYRLFITYWMFFMFSSLIMGFSFYTQDLGTIISGTAFVTFLYTLFAWLLGDELSSEYNEKKNKEVQNGRKTKN